MKEMWKVRAQWFPEELPSLWLLFLILPTCGISPTQKTNKQEGADKAQLTLGYPSHPAPLRLLRGGLRVPRGTAHQNSHPSVSSRGPEIRRRGEVENPTRKIIAGTKSWRGVGHEEYLVCTHEVAGSGPSPSCLGNTHFCHTCTLSVSSNALSRK